jgi:O-antigen/teichoic acid export membrane protein
MRAQLFWAVLWKGTGILATFLGTLLVTRTLGLQQAGWVALGQSTAMVVSTVALLGMDTAAMRELSAYLARGMQHAASSLVATALLGGLLATVIVVIMSAGVVGIGHASGLFFLQDGPIMLIGIATAAGLAGSRLIGELLRATGAIGPAVWFQGAFGPLLTVTGMFLCRHFLSDRLALSIIVAGECSSAAWAWLWWHRVWLTPVPRPNVRMLKTLVRSGLAIFLISLGTALIGWVEIMALNHWNDAGSIALFSLAVRVASLVAMPLLVINLVAAPRYAACYAVRDMARLKALATQVIGFSCLVGVPLIACLLGFGPQILRIFGPEFVAANDSLRIVLVGQFANMLCGPVIYLLMMSGKERTGLACVMLAVLVDMISVSILVPRHGLTGAAISNALGVSVMNIGAAIMTFRDLFRQPTAIPQPTDA